MLRTRMHRGHRPSGVDVGACTHSHTSEQHTPRARGTQAGQRTTLQTALYAPRVTHTPLPVTAQCITGDHAFGESTSSRSLPVSPAQGRLSRVHRSRAQRCGANVGALGCPQCQPTSGGAFPKTSGPIPGPSKRRRGKEATYRLPKPRASRGIVLGDVWEAGAQRRAQRPRGPDHSLWKPSSLWSRARSSLSSSAAALE